MKITIPKTDAAGRPFLGLTLGRTRYEPGIEYDVDDSTERNILERLVAWNLIASGDRYDPDGSPVKPLTSAERKRKADGKGWTTPYSRL